MKSGNELNWLGGILGCAVLVGALISPAVTYGLTALPADMNVFGETVHIPKYIAQKGHAAIFSRVVLVAVIIGLVVFWRRLGITRPARLGLPFPRAFHWRDIAAGAAIGIVSVGLMVGVKYAVGEFVWKVDSKSAGRVIGAVFSGAIVGLMEEIICHGLIFGGLYRRMGLWPAFAITNLIYSVSHSLNAIKGEAKANIVVNGPLDIAASLQCLSEFVGGAAADPVTTGMKFTSLFLFGALLTYTVVRRRTVYLAIGLHAGVVFFLLADGAFRALNDEFDYRGMHWLLGGKQIESSVAGQAAMLIGLGLATLWMKFAPTSVQDRNETDFLPDRPDPHFPAAPENAGSRAAVVP